MTAPLVADALGAVPAALRLRLGPLIEPIGVGGPERWLALYADGSLANDVVLGGPRVGFEHCVDLRLLREHRPGKFAWLTRGMLAERLLWVSGGALDRCRALGAAWAELSQRRVAAVRAGLAPEELPRGPLEALADEVERRFAEGVLYARGVAYPARLFGERFEDVARAARRAIAP